MCSAVSYELFKATANRSLDLVLFSLLIKIHSCMFCVRKQSSGGTPRPFSKRLLWWRGSKFRTEKLLKYIFWPLVFPPRKHRDGQEAGPELLLNKSPGVVLQTLLLHCSAGGFSHMQERDSTGKVSRVHKEWNEYIILQFVSLLHIKYEKYWELHCFCLKIKGRKRGTVITSCFGSIL